MSSLARPTAAPGSAPAADRSPDRGSDRGSDRAADTAGAAPRFLGRTYARARLLLGVTGVGSQVLLALAALALDWPGRFLPRSEALPLGETLAALLPALLVPALALLPLDVLGGMVVVRTRPALARWVAGLARGVAVQVAVWFAALTAYVVAARAGGAPAVLAAGLAVQLALLAARAPLAAATGGLRALDNAPLARAAREALGDPAARVRTLCVPDESFVGGWTGLVAPRTLHLPERWATLPARVRGALLARRAAVAAGGWRGLHARGVLLAMAWNLAGLALALWWAGVDARSAAGAATLALVCAPWTFLGLLVLPTPSRRGVLAADRAAAARVGADAVRAAIVAADRTQDDEPARTRAIETIFHPIPARDWRLAALDAARGGHGLAAHQAARHALYLAWGLASPLSRAVHCNVGRPALWVLFPGD